LNQLLVAPKKSTGTKQRKKRPQVESEAIASHLEDLLIPSQITEVYTVEELINSQVIAVVNFPAKRGAGVESEVLVLAVVKENGRAILLGPTQKVKNKLKLA